MKACRICLRMNAPMCLLGNSEAKNFLDDILRQNGHQKGMDCRHYVCLICKQLLTKSYNFIKRALTAQNVLCEIINKQKKVTGEALKSINRYALNLDDNFSCKIVCKIDILHDDDIEVQKKSLAPTEYEEDLIEDINEDFPDVLNIDFENDNKQHGFSSEITVIDETLIKECCNESDTNEIEICNNTISKDPLVDVIIKNEIDLDVTSKISKSQNDKENSHVASNILYKQTRSTHGAVATTKAEKKPVARKPVAKKVQPPRKKSKRDCDEDFDPGSMSESDSDGYDSDLVLYDDNGRRMKKPDERVYPMDCAECNYEIQSKLDHFHHYITFHRDKEYPYKGEKRLICDICGVVKTRETHFEEHLRRHYESEKKFQCTDCGNKFYDKKTLHGHMKRHSTYKLICEYCQKAFPVRSELKLHIRTHTGEKPFSCHICGASYAHRGNMQIHIRTVHQQKPPPEKKKKEVVKGKSKPVVKKVIKKRKPIRKKKHAKKTSVHNNEFDDDDVPLKLLKR